MRVPLPQHLPPKNSDTASAAPILITLALITQSFLMHHAASGKQRNRNHYFYAMSPIIQPDWYSKLNDAGDEGF